MVAAQLRFGLWPSQGASEPVLTVAASNPSLAVRDVTEPLVGPTTLIALSTVVAPSFRGAAKVSFVVVVLGPLVPLVQDVSSELVWAFTGSGVRSRLTSLRFRIADILTPSNAMPTICLSAV